MFFSYVCASVGFIQIYIQIPVLTSHVHRILGEFSLKISNKIHNFPTKFNVTLHFIPHRLKRRMSSITLTYQELSTPPLYSIYNEPNYLKPLAPLSFFLSLKNPNSNS